VLEYQEWIYVEEDSDIQQSNNVYLSIVKVEYWTILIQATSETICHANHVACWLDARQIQFSTRTE